jgi:hypothetical protein
VLAAAASSIVIAVACAATPPLEPLHVELRFAAAMTPAASKAVAEAAQVWLRYRVVIDSNGRPDPGAVLVRVTIGDRAPSTSGDARAVGSIDFENGRAVPEIRLYRQRAWDVICAVAGSDAGHWPLSYRDMMVGRVLGRALAHELGHFLLQSKEHTATGLMRAAPPIADLVGESRAPLFLTREEIEDLSRGYLQ